MSRTIILIPVSTGVGLTSISLGLIHSLEQKGTKVAFMKPVSQPSTGEDKLIAQLLLFALALALKLPNLLC